MMKKLSSIFPWVIALIAAVAGSFQARGISVDQVENVHLADRTRFVTDQAGVMSPGARAQADSILADIWRQTSAEPVVVIVDSTDGEDIDEYATELFTRWGIGKKDRDNGVLVLISIGDRRNIFRTGYGTETILPDIACYNISTKKMNPRFKEGDYDGGIIAGLQAMHAAMTSPEAREELMSEIPNDAVAASGEDVDMWSLYLHLSIIVGVFMLCVVVWLFISTRGKNTVTAYEAWDRWKLPAIMASVMCLGFPLPALIVMLLWMRHIRLRKHKCPNCGTPMHRLDEQTDNNYLTPSQDLEEHLNSVDYDVWVCPSCNEKDIIPYINPRSNFTDCPNCGAKADRFVGERVLRQPTERAEGIAVKEYECLNCKNRRMLKRIIPKLPLVAVVPGAGFGGKGGGFGGGFGGGSFGGGMTGGGGSSTGW